MKKPRPFGWDVEVEFALASKIPPTTFHYRGCSERQAYMKAMMKRNAWRVTGIRPVTEEQWVRAYGLGRM